MCTPHVSRGDLYQLHCKEHHPDFHIVSDYVMYVCSPSSAVHIIIPLGIQFTWGEMWRKNKDMDTREQQEHEIAIQHHHHPPNYNWLDQETQDHMKFSRKREEQRR